MTINKYIDIVNKRFKSGKSSEHTYRIDLELLIRELVQEVEVTNEPKNATKCGNPDYLITRGGIEVGFIEAKDIGKDLNSKQYEEQFGRYKKEIDNLIITDYLWFQFFLNGELVSEIRIGKVEKGRIKPIPENYTIFKNLLEDFCTYIGQTIKSSEQLAKEMAKKARRLKDVLENAITLDEKKQENSSLKGQYDKFKEILIHDLKPKDFADIYAQTLAYGMFAARLHDTTLNNFSRQEAAELIPKSNPFLRKLFEYVAGPEIDERIKTVVDSLAGVFRATNIDALLHNFEKGKQTNDPIIHFYETFLSQYDPKLRKARGVWYTPEPVVNFIVRAVDDILKTEFSLPQGLADISKTKIKLNTQTADKRSSTGYRQTEKEVHKVQILDPATGTGTFLAEVVKLIYNKNFKGMQGAWSGYVEKHLIPRLNGFEILMASYAMAHIKLEMLLTETGYKSIKNDRLNIYLTNSLEEYHQDTGNLFGASWLSTEANEANHIKRDTPVMCVIGNPPYAVSSANKGKWIQDLLKDYKKDLNERKINLDDDYIKFLRYGQYYIDKNGEGILAYISNNSFIDGITHRQMRKNLLETFDKIYILDLHGSAKKNETTIDGGKDENVFDIQQGVSINIFVKTGKKKKNTLGKVFHSELFGKREVKDPFLYNNSISTIKWETLENKKPYFFFVPKDFEQEEKYIKGFKIDKLLDEKVSGFQTKRDKTTIKISEKELKDIKEVFLTKENEEIRTDLKLPADGRDWKISWAKEDLRDNSPIITKIMYRPFDNRFTYYTGKSKGFVAYPRGKMLRHLNKSDTLSLITCRQQSTFDFQHVFISRLISDMCNISSQTKETGYIFPLYLYPNEKDEIFTKNKRIPNLNQEIVKQIAEKLGLTFTNEKEETENTFAPIDILDYIYSVLHSPTYRDKYKEFLKIDFPRVPYPKDKTTFWQLVKLGKEVREIHLLESIKLQDSIARYEIEEDAEKDHDHITTKIAKKDWKITNKDKQCGRITINESRYFDNIPLVAWEFYIGGYQPAQKWLKDRRGRKLEIEDIIHYRKIIVALSETDRIMKEIDRIKIE